MSIDTKVDTLLDTLNILLPHAIKDKASKGITEVRLRPTESVRYIAIPQMEIPYRCVTVFHAMGETEEQITQWGPLDYDDVIEGIRLFTSPSGSFTAYYDSEKNRIVKLVSPTGRVVKSLIYDDTESVDLTGYRFELRQTDGYLGLAFKYRN